MPGRSFKPHTSFKDLMTAGNVGQWRHMLEVEFVHAAHLPDDSSRAQCRKQLKGDRTSTTKTRVEDPAITLRAVSPYLDPTTRLQIDGVNKGRRIRSAWAAEASAKISSWGMPILVRKQASTVELRCCPIRTRCRSACRKSTSLERCRCRFNLRSST